MTKSRYSKGPESIAFRPFEFVEDQMLLVMRRLDNAEVVLRLRIAGRKNRHLAQPIMANCRGVKVQTEAQLRVKCRVKRSPLDQIGSATLKNGPGVHHRAHMKINYADRCWYVDLARADEMPAVGVLHDFRVWIHRDMMRRVGMELEVAGRCMLVTIVRNRKRERQNYDHRCMND